MARKTKTDMVLEKLGQLETGFQRNNALLEEMQAQLRVVADGVLGIQETLDEKIDKKLEVVKLDVEVLKATARVHTAQLERLETRVDGVDAKVDRMDKRAATLEKKVG